MHELPAMSQGGFLQEMAVGSYDIHYSYLPLPDDDDDFLPGLHVDAEDAYLGNMFDEQVKSEYDMGGEGDLFKAPEHFLVEAELELDPMATAMPIIYGGGDVITEIIKVASMESIQNDHLGGLFCECKKDLLEESEIEISISELLDVKIPVVQIDEVPPLKDLSQEDGSMQKSISSGCLNSVEWVPGSTMRPEFFDFQELDFEAAFGLKRSYSEGDIGDLGTKNTRIGSTTAVCSSFEQLLTISDLKTEQRQLKLSRYREKKSKRNFGKKIKYACRKALADSQPRVRGRFAKTEECKHRSRQAVEVGSGSRCSLVLEELSLQEQMPPK